MQISSGNLYLNLDPQVLAICSEVNPAKPGSRVDEGGRGFARRRNQGASAGRHHPRAQPRRHRTKPRQGVGKDGARSREVGGSDRIKARSRKDEDTRPSQGQPQRGSLVRQSQDLESRPGSQLEARADLG